MKPETHTFYEAAVDAAIEAIRRSLDDALDLERLARGASLSSFHFHRVFRGMVGETPLEMHRRLRLERAARDLLITGAPVTTLAFDAGYETHEAFTRAFRQAYGTSPSAFRQSANTGMRPPQIQLPARSGLHVDSPSDQRPTLTHQGASIMNVQIESMPALRLATVHHKGPYARVVEAFVRLDGLVRASNLVRPETMLVGIYHDDPDVTPIEQLRSDAGITVTEGVELPAGLTEVRLPASRYARTTHVGPYTALGDTWERLMGEWLPRSGERVGGGSSFEVYRNTPADVPPEKLRTDLYLPIA